VGELPGDAIDIASNFEARMFVDVVSRTLCLGFMIALSGFVGVCVDGGSSFAGES
jgi:hypothetical protein